MPVSTGVTISRTKPRFTGHTDGITVSHRELLTSVSSVTSAWAYNDDYDLNPGNAETFPWLANMAWSYESYKIRNIAFVYEPRCATTQAGAVLLFTDFDSADSAPASEQFAASYEGFVESPPYKRVVHRPNLAGLQQSKSIKYVTPPTGVPTGADPANYNSGTFWLFTTGTGTATLGSLWVEYTIDLIHPTAGVGETLRIASSSVGSIYDYSNTGNTFMSASVTDYPVNELKDMCGTTFEPTIVSPSNALVCNLDDGYSFTLDGPATYNVNLTMLHGNGGTGMTWLSFPSYTDIIDTISEGLKYIDVTNPFSAGKSGQYSTLSVGLTFAVIGAKGILRFLTAAHPYRYTNTGSIPQMYNFDLEVGYRGPWSPPPEMKVSEYITQNYLKKPKKVDKVEAHRIEMFDQPGGFRTDSKSSSRK